MFFKAPLLVLLLFAVTVSAQAGTCPELVKTALAASDTLCAPTGRNQACYGHVDLSVVPHPTAADFTFQNAGDIEDVADIQSLKLEGMDENSQRWGVVLMRLQTNIPNILPGQNTTFLLFGDVEITSAVTEEGDNTPMQAFVLRTGFQDTLCEEAPQSGLLVQTPKGVGQVTFNVNGVDVSMGSTAFFQAQAGRSMKVRTVEGATTLEAEGKMIPVIAGTESEVPMTEDMEPAGVPSDPEAYELEEIGYLPLESLEYEVEIADPLDEEMIDMLNDLIDAGEAVCGFDFLPSCDELPAEMGGEGCLMTADSSLMEDPNFCGEEDYAQFEQEAAEALTGEPFIEEQPSDTTEEQVDAPLPEDDNSGDTDTETETDIEQPPDEAGSED